MRRLPLALLLFVGSPAWAGLPEDLPESVGIDSARLAKIDAAVDAAIRARVAPGAVVLVARHGKVVHARAYGLRAVMPQAEPMTRDTVFDMASLTKPVVTATSVMLLIDQKKLSLENRLGDLLPEFDNHGKGAITLEQLLRHRAGLVADNPIADFANGPAEAWKRMASLELAYEPGTKYLYSDVGFMILGRIVERVSGVSLDRFFQERVARLLGMHDSRFLPTATVSEASVLNRCAPTEPETPGGAMLRGVVHDPRSRRLGGVAGHAGLFSTADDLAVFAQTFLDSGLSPDGAHFLEIRTVGTMIDPGSTPPHQRRGLGWDVDTPHSAPRGRGFGVHGFGHTGFTGTSLWVDRDTDSLVIVLTSRLHPDGKAPAPSALRSEVATIVAAAIDDDDGAPVHPVTCGVDILARDQFSIFKGKRVGLVTNHTGRTREGVPTIDALFKAPGVKLTALFSPEHGIRGLVDAAVPDSRDERTGLPIHSLYGKTRKPTPEMLKDLDLLVYDIQDIGTRYYTYISTLGLVLEAAKDRGIPLWVLDRPNPIGGLEVAGPVRDDGFESFIAYHALPVRHGMTVGELAAMFNAERKIGADLRVVHCNGWQRRDLFDRTGLVWVNPSPNMRSLTEALLYPGVGLLEATNLATGRGTDTPFERIGAPWIDPPKFAEALNALRLPGVRFYPIRFTPRERQFAGLECGGVFITIVDRARFEPVSLGNGVARILHSLYPREWKSGGFLTMLADRAAYQAVLAGKTPAEVESVWKAELAEFLQLRARYLVYR